MQCGNDNANSNTSVIMAIKNCNTLKWRREDVKQVCANGNSNGNVVITMIVAMF